VDAFPLVLLALVVVGGAIVFRSMVRLKRAAVGALQAAKDLEARLAALKAQTDAQAEALGRDRPSPPGS
jgi:hypothetical protein